MASILALRAIRNTSPVRPAERRAERRWIERARERRRNAEFYRGLLAYCGVPQQPARQHRQVEPQRPAVELPVVLSSDTSGDNLPEPQQQRPIVLVDLDSSIESLPDIDPRPQCPLPVEPLVDLGHLDITVEFPPPIQHRMLREAYVLLSRLQLPPLQLVAPPPEFPLRPPTPPPEQRVDWEGLEAAVAEFDAPGAFELPPQLGLEQPEVAACPQYMPANFAAPPPLPPVDWAMVAYALFTIAERDSQQRIEGTGGD